MCNRWKEIKWNCKKWLDFQSMLELGNLIFIDTVTDVILGTSIWTMYLLHFSFGLLVVLPNNNALPHILVHVASSQQPVAINQTLTCDYIKSLCEIFATVGTDNM